MVQCSGMTRERAVRTGFGIACGGIRERRGTLEPWKAARRLSVLACS